MNIGIDIRSLTTPYRTGVGEYSAELLYAIFSVDKTNQYFLFYNSWEDCSRHVPTWEQDNVHFVVTKYPNKMLNATLALVRRPYLDSFCHPERVDVFFSPNLNFTSVSPQTKYILTIHDLSFEFFPKCFTAKHRLWHRAVAPREQCKRADIILTPSENTKRDVVDFYGVPEEKVRVVYPGGMSNAKPACRTGRCQMSNVDTIRRKYHLPEKFMLFLGTIEPRKNILSIIEAYKQLSPISYRLSLVIAGPRGWKCDKVFRAMSATPGVRYIGYVAPEDKPALYQLAQMFVYPSMYEGFGFPVLEAMAAGTPVITSNRTSLPEVVGDAAYFVNPLNVAEITQGMRALSADTALRDRLVARGRERAKEFTWDNAANTFLNILSCE